MVSSLCGSVFALIICYISVQSNAFHVGPRLNVVYSQQMCTEGSEAERVNEWVGAKKFSTKDRYTKTVFSNEQIAKILPHRYPFLLVDKVVEFEPGKRAVGIKCVSANEPQFTGHFPDRPIMPGVLMVEAMAQLGTTFTSIAKYHQLPSSFY
jgi:hypothetical protein